MPLDTPYRYVNAACAWPGAVVDGLVADAEGRLRLPPGPGVATLLVPLSLDPLDGLVGLAAADDGTLWVADPGAGRIMRVDPCDRRVAVFGCLDRASGDPAAPQCPRGLALGPRETLVIADPCSGRVLLADRATGALRTVWDGFVEPWGVAVDADGNVIVADADAGAGAAALRRFDADGAEDTAFAAATSALGLHSPRAVALLAGGAIVVFDEPFRAVQISPDGAHATVIADDLNDSLALVADAETLWTAGGGGVAALTAGVTAHRADVPAAGIAIHCDGRVLLATPDGVLALAPGGFGAHGTLVVPAPDGLLPWDRVRALLAEPLPASAHVRVWLRGGAAAPPPPPTAGDGSEAPFPTAVGTWRRAPLDVLDVRPLLDHAERLWIAVELHGNGTATPTLDDVRVDRMAPGWLDDLPRTLVGAEPDQLERLLALLASIYEDTASGIDALPAELDAAATADRPELPLLARIARWVDIGLPERLGAAERRELVRDAMLVHDRRGTVAGIVGAVRRETGVTVTISEPSLPPAWPLGAAAGLAFGTALPAAPAGPPVLDTTAIVDRSWLIDPDERGLPLLGSVAHRFCVQAAEHVLSDDGVRAEIERVVEREKPAHTAFELRAVSPHTVVGHAIEERTTHD